MFMFLLQAMQANVALVLHPGHKMATGTRANCRLHSKDFLGALEDLKSMKDSKTDTTFQEEVGQPVQHTASSAAPDLVQPAAYSCSCSTCCL